MTICVLANMNLLNQGQESFAHDHVMRPQLVQREGIEHLALWWVPICIRRLYIIKSNYTQLLQGYTRIHKWQKSEDSMAAPRLPARYLTISMPTNFACNLYVCYNISL